MIAAQHLRNVTLEMARVVLLAARMKTTTTKKLSLDLETVRTLTGAALENIVGGRAHGIVSTDTPSGCFDAPSVCVACPDVPTLELRQR